MEIIQTGSLQRIAYENTEDVAATRLFSGIYGVGQTTAYQWYASGCRTLEDVKSGKGGVKLSPAMEIGLRFYEGLWTSLLVLKLLLILSATDINSRMPRGEAEALFDLIKPIGELFYINLDVDRALTVTMQHFSLTQNCSSRSWVVFAGAHSFS